MPQTPVLLQPAEQPPAYKPHPHAVLLHAWANGLTIQIRLGDSGWHDMNPPDFAEGALYREKPPCR